MEHDAPTPDDVTTPLPVRVENRVLNWAPDLHPEAALQAARLAQLPVTVAKDLVDEAPAAYKPIEQVMHHQLDLVRIIGRLRQVVNLKGSDHDH